MKAIILVAGYATRLYPLTINTPKALLPINKKPIIDYIMEQIDTIPQIDEVFVVSNHKFADQFEAWANAHTTKKLVNVIDDGTDTEETRRGAIGDILFAIKQEKITDEIVVIAGDNLFTYSLEEYFDYFKKIDKDCVCVKPFEDREMLKQFGIAAINDDGKVTDIEEKPQNPKSNLVVFATYMYKKDTIPMFEQYIAEGNKPDAPGYFVEWLYKRKDVYAFTFNEECYDIGTPKSLKEVSDIFEKKHG